MVETPPFDMVKEDAAAELLLMSPSTLKNKRSRGDVDGPPYIRLSGGAIRYSRKALAEWIAANTITPRGAA